MHGDGAPAKSRFNALQRIFYWRKIDQRFFIETERVEEIAVVLSLRMSYPHLIPLLFFFLSIMNLLSFNRKLSMI